MSRIIPLEEIEFIRKNFHDMTNQELADHLGVKYSTMCTRIHLMGLKRIKTDQAAIKARANSSVPTKEAQAKGGGQGKGKTRKDILEECFTPRQIREFYAKYVYGQGASYPIEEIPWQVKAEAGLNPIVNEQRPPKCLNEIVEELAQCWGSFNRK